ncbi:MAG TPA: EAL domain-containing protein [Baekduia sp.]|nr:EAL domain-containing protein [Baekduia sp.]
MDDLAGVPQDIARRLAELTESERLLRARSEQQARDNRVLLETLHQHQHLHEAMASVRRAISARAPLPEVLETIVEAVSDLFGGSAAGLYLLDPDDPDFISLVAHQNFRLTTSPIQRRRLVGVGVAGRAVKDGELKVIDDYLNGTETIEEFKALGVSSVMAAPVFEEGAVNGCLIVPFYGEPHEFSTAEKETLTTLAEHVSLALTDAKTVESMVHQALHDGLTGLPNRALFHDRLEHALIRARRVGALTAVLFLDLDRFKNVNDSLGHAAGDDLLVEVARRIDGCRRAADTAARLGGDEFAVLLEDLSDTNEALRVARRIVASVQRPFVLGEREVRISTAIGIAIGEPEADDFLRHADVAMYRAKAAGRGEIAIFEDEMQDELLERLELENELRPAIAAGEIEIHYQPVVEIGSGALVGFEALARWSHPERGLLTPASFIEIAEETGAIIDLGRFVLRVACEQASAWVGAMPADRPFISVNLSGWQLEHDDLINDVRLALAASGIDPSMLMLEITETVLMKDADDTIERLQQLRAIGVRIAIDDFGTGYSSLRYLRNFPVDALKMAKPFVDGLAHDKESAALARTIIDLASSLGISCIAEGIETIDQHSKLTELGCELGQGFHFAQPASSEHVSNLLREQRIAYPV